MNELSEKAFDLINEFKARCIDACCDADSWYERDKAQVALRDYIAELEAEIDIRKDQLREAKNILVDKKLHIDSLYEDGYKLQQLIAELEAEKSILEDQLREANNYLVDKILHIDSLYEDGYKMQQRIAELEAAQPTLVLDRIVKLEKKVDQILYEIELPRKSSLSDLVYPEIKYKITSADEPEVRE